MMVYFFSYNKMSEHQQEKLTLTRTSLRILHNIGNSGNNKSPEIDVYLDAKVIAYNLMYDDFTAYISVCNGNHTLTAKQANTDIIVAQGKVRFYDNASYTAIIAGSLNDPQSTEIIVNQDNLRCPRPGSSTLRFIHAAADFDSVDVYSGDDLIFANVAYGQSTSYKELKLGYSQLSIVRVGQSSSLKTSIANPYLVSGGGYSVILSLNAPLTEYYLHGIVAEDTHGICEQLQHDFDISGFMGKWHLISSIPQSYDTNCPRATAEYTQLQNYIRIVNTCYNEDWVPSSSISVKGIQEPCNTASLIVTFHQRENTPPRPNYLIHRTDYNGFAIIGTPNRTGLWILSRRPKMTLDQYQRLVHYSRRLGYDVNLLKVKYHSLTRGEKHSTNNSQ